MNQKFRFANVAILLFVLAVGNAFSVSLDKSLGNLLEVLAKPNPIKIFTANSHLSDATTQMLRLDSMIIDIPMNVSDSDGFFPNQKVLFHYNSYGLMDVSTHLMDEEGTGIALPYQRTVSTYDGYGHKTSDSTYEVVNNDKQLTLTEILEFRYSPSGVLLMKNRKSKIREDLSWIGNFGEEYEYDNLGRLAVQREYTLTDDGSWTIVRKKDFTYNASNNPLTETRYYWDQSKNDWTGLDKTERIYDDSQRDTMVLYFSYYPLETRWNLGIRDLNQYDSTGHLLLRINELWDEASSRWMEDGKEEFAYDAFGYRILEAKFNMDRETKTWEPQSKEVWKYDQLGNLQSDTSFSNLQEDKTWGMATISDYRYDYQVRAENAALDFTPDAPPSYNLLTGMSLTWSFPAMDTSFVMADVTLHYSTMEILGITPQKPAEQGWFYESSTKTIHFAPSLKTSTVQVLDIQGRMLLNSQASDRLSLNNFSKGIYLIRLATRSGVQLGKVKVE